MHRVESVNLTCLWEVSPFITTQEWNIINLEFYRSDRKFSLVLSTAHFVGTDQEVPFAEYNPELMRTTSSHSVKLTESEINSIALKLIQIHLETVSIGGKTLTSRAVSSEPKELSLERGLRGFVASDYCLHIHVRTDGISASLKPNI